MLDKKFIIHPAKKFELTAEYKTYSDDCLLSAVEPIEDGMVQLNEQAIENFIEYPLIDAIKVLHSKGISTWSSSANKKDLNAFAYISINYDLLSEENKKIAVRFEQFDYLQVKYISIKMPIKHSTTVGEVRRYFTNLANAFQSQN